MNSFIKSTSRLFSMLWHRAEDSIVIISLILLSLFPSIEIVSRAISAHTPLNFPGIPASSDYIHHLVVIITFCGAMITSRENRHLTIAMRFFSKNAGKLETFSSVISGGIYSAFTAIMSFTSAKYIYLAFPESASIGQVPLRPVMLIIPVSFAVITLRVLNRVKGPFYNRILSALFIAIPFILLNLPLDYASVWFWPIFLILILSASNEVPIYAVLGSIAAILFIKSGGFITVIPNEAYTMLTGPIMPTIPLFTLAGFILSESNAGKRLVRLFRTAFGWMPGGMAIATISICTFFTALTGASGITIMALGGLLMYILEKNRYPSSFSTGLLTVNGIGTLFPPSLPLIMFGVVAGISIKQMFLGSLIPGNVMVTALSLYVIYTVRKKDIPRLKFSFIKLILSVKHSIFEILLPVFIILLFFSGITTIVETGAFSVIYALLVTVVIHKDIEIRSLPGIFLKSVPIMGGVLIILALAQGLSYYLVDASLPSMLTSWMESNIESKYVFLLLLNISLLAAGCLMDVFSAITVIVPLILPLADLYGINHIHLGIIFLANLEVGYLTPPVGINLFLASYRFKKPMTEIYRSVLPFLIIMFISVLLITYIPVLTTLLPDLLNFE